MPTIGRGLFRWLFCSGARLEDFADRLNHVWTFGLLLILGATISWKHGYQDPISCWCPAEFHAAAVRYAHQTCWHSYYIRNPADEDYNVAFNLPRLDIPDLRQELSNEEKDKFSTTYYQWVPIVLCLQALLFKLPNIILYIFHSFSGIDFDKISGLTSGFENLNLSERSYLSSQISRYIYRWCNMFPVGLPWRFLTFVWFSVKVLFCINIIIQMTYIDRFLKTTNEPYDNSTSYGDAVYDNIARNNATFWKLSPVFPQTVMCSFSIRTLRNIQQYSLQCELNANRFTERAYTFLWVWLLFVAVVTTVSLAVWMITTLLPIGRKRYIRRFMELAETTHDSIIIHPSDRDVSDVTNLVGQDGVLVLKIIGANSSELLVRDVICGILRLVKGGSSMASGQILQQSPTAQPLLAPSGPPGPVQGMYPSIERERTQP